jgi:hypothetical protein
MKVSMFRVEKPCGTGPYMAKEDHPLLRDMYLWHGDENHPEPKDDPILNKFTEDGTGITPDEVCGFPTLGALETWFAGFEDPLHECGYEIVVYSVPLTSVRYGLNQSVFLTRDAEPDRTLSLIHG